MDDLEKYKKIGKELMDKLKLLTYPVAVRLVPPDEEVSTNALRPHKVFGSEVPACLTYTWCRRSGFSFFLKGEDIACKPASIRYFGLEETSNPDDVFIAWEKKAGYKRNGEAEKRSRELDAVLKPGEIKGIIISPLNLTIVKPHLVMIFCTPLILSHLILAYCYDGDHITSHFNGMESSCKEGIIRTFKTKQCQVVSPGMGDRVMAGVQDNEMLFSIPESKIELVVNNLFKAGSKLPMPAFGIPHLNASLGPISIYGSPVEPGVWPLLRKKIKKE
ncbi:MAG: hypothetical protein EU529_04560 [Promethearchaeota archaeon]|nr:MAG: hypothetical protein EU529_04560 [Candidatus Lokiarchaeota archaeon]